MAQRRRQRPRRRPAGQRPRSGPRSAGPARPPHASAKSASTGGQREVAPSGLRRAVERHSAAPLVYLRGLPRVVVPLALVALAVTGLVWSGPGAFALLLFVAVFLTWLVYLSWPLLSGVPKMLRVLTILVILAGAAYRLVA